jgi:hypothetical protein
VAGPIRVLPARAGGYLALPDMRRLIADAPGEPLLVWYGGGHAAKVPAGEWVTMGCHFPGMSGVEAFVIDQTVTVEWKGRPQPGIPELLETLSDMLAACGGTAGILREQTRRRWTPIPVPTPWSCPRTTP